MENTSSAAPLSAPLQRHALRGGLPWPPPPSEKHLQHRPLAPFRRLIAIWLFFLVVIVVIWAAFSSGVRLPALPVGVAYLVGGGLFVGLFGAAVARVKRFNVKNSAALAQLNRGDVDDAAAVFDDLARRHLSSPQLHTVALHNLAIAEGRRGRHDRALALHATVIKKGSNNPAIADTARFAIAADYALLGDLDGAEAWLADAERQRKLAHVSLDAFARAVVWTRRQRFADVVTLLESRWRELEAGDSALGLRANKVLLAFALAHVEGRADYATAVLQSAHSPTRGQLDWLGTHWPEMQAFVVEKRL